MEWCGSGSRLKGNTMVMMNVMERNNKLTGVKDNEGTSLYEPQQMKNQAVMVAQV